MMRVAELDVHCGHESSAIFQTPEEMTRWISFETKNSIRMYKVYIRIFKQRS